MNRTNSAKRKITATGFDRDIAAAGMAAAIKKSAFSCRQNLLPAPEVRREAKGTVPADLKAQAKCALDFRFFIRFSGVNLTEFSTDESKAELTYRRDFVAFR